MNPAPSDLQNVQLLHYLNQCAFGLSSAREGALRNTGKEGNKLFGAVCSRFKEEQQNKILLKKSSMLQYIQSTHSESFYYVLIMCHVESKHLRCQRKTCPHIRGGYYPNGEISVLVSSGYRNRVLQTGMA